MWTCSVCNRSFRNRNQSHSCMNLTIDHLLENKTSEIIDICMIFIEKAEGDKDIRVSLVKNAILFAVKSIFFVLKPKSTHVDVALLLNVQKQEFPVYKIIKVYGSQFAHFIKTETRQEVDEQLINCFHLACSQNKSKDNG